MMTARLPACLPAWTLAAVVLLGATPAAAEALLVAHGGDVVTYPTRGRAVAGARIAWGAAPPDASGQVCLVPGDDARFVVAYGPPTAKSPAQGHAEYRPDGGAFAATGRIVASGSGRRPVGCAFDLSGSLFVSEVGSEQGCDGALIEFFGPYLTASRVIAEDLCAPGQIAVDPADAVYVPERAAGRVTRFARPYAAADRSVFVDDAAHGLSAPTAIVRTADGGWIISGVGEGGVINRYDAGGAFAGAVAPAGVARDPVALALDAQGRLYSLESNPGDPAGALIARQTFRKGGVPGRRATFIDGLGTATGLAMRPCTASLGERCRPATRITIARGEWPVFGHDLRHTFFNSKERKLGRRTVGSLTEKWRFATVDAVTAPPSLVGGYVYVGDWMGWVYKLRAADGALVWKTQTDFDPMVDTGLYSDGGHITGGITVADVRRPRALGGRQRWLFVGSGKTLYAIRDGETEGTVVWKRIVPGNPDNPDDPFDPVRILTSVALFDGHLFFGTVVDGSEGYRGRFFKARAETGEIVGTFETDQGAGGVLLNRGCGSTWSAPAIEEDLRQVYFATSDCTNSPLNPRGPDGEPQPPYAECVISLRADDLSIAWTFCPRTVDECDMDFGSASVLLDGPDGPLVAHGGKDGLMRGFDAATGAPVWGRQVVEGGSAAGFIGSVATDGTRIVGGTAIGNTWRRCPLPAWQTPHVHAFDARTGNVLWQVVNNPTFGGTSIANGVVFLPAFGFVRAYDIDTGAVLYENGTLPLGAFDSPFAIAKGMVFFGAGQGTHEGYVFGFGLP